VREDEEEEVSSYWMTLKKGEVNENWKRSTRSHCLQKTLWKRLGTCRKKDYAREVDDNKDFQFTYSSARTFLKLRSLNS